MIKSKWIILLSILMSQDLSADNLDVVCFFPDKVNFEEINKTCNKGDLIRTKPNLAELVCDWDKQIFKYTEDDKEWVTCVYHGHARSSKMEVVQKHRSSQASTEHK